MSEEVGFVLAIAFAVAAIAYLSFGGISLSGKLSTSDIARYAGNAGFSGDDLVTAIAIALAESGGDPNIEGDNGTSYGLWQIHWTVHPEFDKTKLKNPQYNAQAAFTLFTRRGNFNDWSTFGDLPGHNNAYLDHLDAANAAVNA